MSICLFFIAHRRLKKKNSPRTTFDTDPSRRAVKKILQANVRTHVDYPPCVPGPTQRVITAELQFRCIAVMKKKLVNENTSVFLRSVKARPAGPCTGRQYESSRGRVLFANRQSTSQKTCIFNHIAVRASNLPEQSKLELLSAMTVLLRNSCKDCTITQ